jgi:membrane associated rhomboid family serine protease
MEAGAEVRYEVWRGNRKLLEGSAGDLVRAAERGVIRHSDLVAAPGAPERLPPHAFRDLAPLVPGEEEAAARSRLRILLVLTTVAGASLLLVAAMGFAAGAADGRLVIGAAIVFAVLLVAPTVALRRRVRMLAELRLRGMIPDPDAPRTTGDPDLDALLLRKPVVARAFTFVIVGSSLVAFVVPEYLAALAKVNERILEGEWWRLVTVALVHGGLLHLAFNGFALWNLGGLAEALYGRTRLAILFIVGTALATGASVLYTAANAVGASGGVFAVIGALLVFGLRARGTIPEPVRRRLVKDMAWIVGVNVLFGVSVPYVDNAAHLGGLAAGAALGAALGAPAIRKRRLIRS